MTFIVGEISDQQIVFSKGETIKLPFILMSFFGLIFSATGIFILSHGEDSFLHGGVFLACGLTPFFIIYFSLIEHRKHLEAIIFYIQKGYVEMQAKSLNKSIQRAYMPFSQIDKIEVRQAYEKSGNKSVLHHYLYLIKKDKEKWLLIHSQSETDILLYKQKIDAGLNLTTAAIDIPPVVLSPNIQVKRNATEDQLEWRLFDWWSIAGSGIISFVIGLLLVYLIQVDALFSFVGGVTIFFMLIFFSSFCYSSYILLTKYDTIFGISISETTLTIYEKNKKGRLIKSKKVLIENISSVTNSIEKNMTAKNISMFINEKDSADYSKLTVYQKAKQKIKTLHHLYFSNLSFVETLELERWIQDKIKERSNVDVL